MTIEEIINNLELQGISVEDFALGNISNPLPNIGRWEETSQKGGVGKGPDWSSVKHFLDHDVYIKTDGYYSSYLGLFFDGGYGSEVKKVIKKIMIYE
jgi:hypothetical protein